MLTRLGTIPLPLTCPSLYNPSQRRSGQPWRLSSGLLLRKRLLLLLLTLLCMLLLTIMITLLGMERRILLLLSFWSPTACQAITEQSYHTSQHLLGGYSTPSVISISY